MSLPLRFVSVVAAFLVLRESAWSGDNAGSQLKIGTVSEELGSNGGCSLQLPSHYNRKEGGYVFTSDLQNHGVVNVNGVDTHVALTKSKKSETDRNPQLGDRSSYWYGGAGLEVRVDYVVTGGCPPKSESCRVVNYDAILTIKRGKTSKTIAAKAVCGN
jgi:hypothetical protein